VTGRVRVIQAPEDEQELLGMEGDVVSWTADQIRVFLDDDKFPTDFYHYEVSVLDN